MYRDIKYLFQNGFTALLNRNNIYYSNFLSNRTDNIAVNRNMKLRRIRKYKQSKTFLFVDIKFSLFVGFTMVIHE